MIKPERGKRISKVDTYLNCAEVFAYRSTCVKRKYGAVIVKDDIPLAQHDTDTQYVVKAWATNDEQQSEVIAALYGKAVAEGSPGFRYYQYTDLTDPTVFEEYMEQVNAAAIYDTGITADYGDELVTLSTCSYHTTDGRFVVVAKKKCV